MPIPIPPDRLLLLMRDHSVELQRKISNIPMQLSIPTDGKGLRVKVSVPKGYRSQIPDNVTFTMDGKSYLIPLETEEDYQNYVLLSPKYASSRRA